MAFPYRMLLILAWLPCVAAGQQNCDREIHGTVRDIGNGRPLELAHVLIPEQKKGAITDLEGKYVLNGICGDSFTVVISHIGCRPDTQVVELESAQSKRVNFWLDHQSDLLQEVVLKEKTPPATQPSEIMKLDAIAVQGKNLASTLEEMKGVHSLETGQNVSKPVIHGLHSNRITTINNGVRQEDQQWGSNHELNLSPFSADEIEVLKGASTVTAGFDAVGGAIIVKQGELPKAGDYQGEILLNGQSQGWGGQTSVNFEQGLSEKWAYSASLLGEFLGDRRAPRYVLSNTGNRKISSSASLAYRGEKLKSDIHYSFYRNEIGILRASHIGNISDLNRAIDSREPWFEAPFSYEINNPRQRVWHQLLSLQNRYRINDEQLLKWNAGLQKNRRQEFDVRRGGRSDIPSVDLNLKTATTSLEHQIWLAENWQSQTGISGMLQRNTNVPGTGSRPILPNYDRYQWCIFTLQKYRTSQGNWELGLRYDRHQSRAFYFDSQNELQTPQFDFQNTAINLGYSASLNEKWNWSLNLASISRAPHVNELLSQGLHHGTATLEYGDENLQPESSINLNNGWEYSSSRFHFSGSFYVNYFRNFIYRRPDREPLLTIRGAFPVFRYTQTDALLSGLDLQANYELNDNLHYEIIGEFIVGQNLEASRPLILMPPWQGQHSLAWGLPVWLNNSTLSITHRWAARQFRYPAQEDLAPPPPGYQLVDLSLSGNIPLQRNKLSYELGITNVLNLEYRNYLNQQRYFSANQGRNFIIKFNYKFSKS